MKRTHKSKIILTALLSFVLFVASVYAFIFQSSFDFSRDEFTSADYCRVISENVSPDARIVDIAMLGAHDAFTHKLRRSNPPNLLDKQLFGSSFVHSIGENGVFTTVVGGFIKRMSMAQKSSAYDMLRHGVRYFDVRVAEYDGEFYTAHGLMSGKLSDYLADVLRFVTENPKELVLLDFRHVYLSGLSYEALLSAVTETSYGEARLKDFINYNPQETKLGELTYRIASDLDGEAKGGAVLFFADIADTDVSYTSANAFGPWHNLNDDGEMLAKIRKTHIVATQNMDKISDVLRMNQAQKTPHYMGAEIFSAISSWSLIDNANNFNAKLIAQPDFADWLKSMPILQIDYADSMKDGFNDKVISVINTHNKAL